MKTTSSSAPSTTGTPRETTRGINRRSVVSGAAWAIPVIAVATAAPAAAASVPPAVCPVAPQPAGWTGPIVTSGNLNGTGTMGWNGTNWATTKDSTTTASLQYYIEFPYNQVAGTTYTFNLNVTANGAAANVTFAYLSIVAGGQALWSASTNSAGSQPNYMPPTNVTQPVTVSYTATTTGTTTFRYLMSFQQTTAAQPFNHNLFLSTPNIVCS